MEVLRHGDDVADRLEAVSALREEEHEERLEALAEALSDQVPEVRAAAAEALGVLGEPGRARLLAALERAPGACEAAQVLAGQAVAYPEAAIRLDPTVAWRGEDSCVTGAFLGLGAVTHPIVLEALASADASRARHGRWVACRVEPSLLASLEARLTSDADDEAVEAERAGLASLLAEPPKDCGQEAEALWRRLFSDPETRQRADAVLEDHPRRVALLTGRLTEQRACMGADALLLLVADGLEPSDEQLVALQQGLAAVPAEGCPTVHAQPTVVHLLQRGVQSGSHEQARARLDLLARLGWRPTTDLARVHAAVIQGDYEAAGGFGRAAGPVLLNALMRYELSEESREHVLAALAGQGRSFAPDVERRLVTVEEPRRRDDLLRVLQRLLGPASERVAAMAVAELERTTSGSQEGIERTQWLAGVIRQAGAAARMPLAEGCVAEGKPQLRAMLLGLLADVDGRRGNLAEKTAWAVLDSGRTDLAATSAATFLVGADRTRVAKRLAKALRQGELSPSEVQLLRVFVGQDAKGADKLVSQAVKRLKDPERLSVLAAQLEAAGAIWPAWVCAGRAFETYRKRLARARPVSEEAAEGEEEPSKAELALELRRRLLARLSRVALDPIQPGKLRLRALKLAAGDAASLPEGGRPFAAALAEAWAGEPNKKLKRYLKKALKTVRKNTRFAAE